MLPNSTTLTHAVADLLDGYEREYRLQNAHLPIDERIIEIVDCAKAECDNRLEREADQLRNELVYSEARLHRAFKFLTDAQIDSLI